MEARKDDRLRTLRSSIAHDCSLDKLKSPDPLINGASPHSPLQAQELTAQLAKSVNVLRRPRSHRQRSVPVQIGSTENSNHILIKRCVFHFIRNSVV